MKVKIAVLGSLIGAAALVGISTDASARTWHRHWKSTACGPSATVIKHNRYGFVGGDSGYRSRTVIRDRDRARFGVSIRERGERFGVREHGGRAGFHANINVRERGGERAGAQLQGNRAGTGANVNSGRSASPSTGANTSSQMNTGGAAGSKATSGAGKPAGSAGGGSSSFTGASGSSK